MRLLFLFLDGIGLGKDDPSFNPFARVNMPNLLTLLDGRRLVEPSTPLSTSRATLLSLDARMGVKGVPQSATGQATLLTGINVPAEIGYHYGPKPNLEVANFLENGNLFNTLKASGKKTALLGAYPPRYFEAIHSGRRLYSAIPLAATSAGLRLKTNVDLADGKALSADFTGEGWRDQLGIAGIPVLTPFQAGQRLAELAECYDFSLFEYWLSDYAGHHQDMEQACTLLQTFDLVMAGLLAKWDDKAGVILLTSDHGNLEDLSTRRHTLNPVPALVIGAPDLRSQFIRDFADLTDISPAIIRFLSGIPVPT